VRLNIYFKTETDLIESLCTINWKAYEWTCRGLFRCFSAALMRRDWVKPTKPRVKRTQFQAGLDPGTSGIEASSFTVCATLVDLRFKDIKQSRNSFIEFNIGYILALGDGLNDRGSRVRFLAGAGNFSLHNRVQNGSGVHPASHPMGTRGSFPGIKRPGREADHPPPSSAEVKDCVELYLNSTIRLHVVVLS
jgi:hypothetical protein